MSDPVLYAPKDAAAECQYIKPEPEGRLQTDSVSFFRVSLEERLGFEARDPKVARLPGAIKTQFNISFDHLNPETFTPYMLSEYQIYVLVSPVTLALWIGKKNDNLKKAGALRIIRAFCSDKLANNLDYIPAYISERKYLDS